MARAEDLFARIEMEGMAAIEALLLDRKSEEAFLDFKRSGDHGAGSSLHNDDKSNLSKALSGFANADGGVIVWGIAAKSGPEGDLASALHPLVDCRAFAARLDDKVSWGTVPPVMGVRSIPVPDATGHAGFVATLIPASTVGPHQSTDGHKYLVRVGSSFQPVTHGVLAGMFGRRPQPKIFGNFVMGDARHYTDAAVEWLDIEFEIHLSNNSAVVARDAYFALQVHDLGSPGSYVTYWPPNPERWQADSSISTRFTTAIAAESNRLAPFGSQLALKMSVKIKLPFTSPLDYIIHCGCDGAPPHTSVWHVPLETLNELYTKNLSPGPANGRTRSVASELAAEFLGLGDPTIIG